MVEITTTNITANTISEIFYIPDLNGNIDVYIPITASSVSSEESDIYIMCDDGGSWCHDASLMYAIHQPQGNVWFLHLTLDRYDYDVNNPEVLTDRSVDIHIKLVAKHNETPILIDHHIIQNGCERDDSEICIFEFCLEASSCNFTVEQDCSFIDEISEEYEGTKTHVLIQEC